MSIRIGIIGVGNMAGYHITGFRKAGAEVVAVADVNTDAASSGAAKHHVPKSYGSVARMLSKEKLDAVSIITPNKFHKPLVLQALAARKHVFCEKPPALNAAEALAMTKAAAKVKRTLMFNFNNRARPESMAMKEYIRKGSVGTINSAQAIWIRRTGLPGFGWFTNKALSGGGPLIDLLHMLDLALHFMDYPQPEWVLSQTFDDFMGNPDFRGPWGKPELDKQGALANVESAAHGFVRFKTGQVLFLRTSWAEMNRREEVSVTFQGTKAGGMVRRLFGRDGYDETSTDSCELYVQENGRSVNRDIVVPVDTAMGRIRAAVNFVRTVEGREKPFNTPDQAVKLMQIVDATYRSAKTGKPVRI